MSTSPSRREFLGQATQSSMILGAAAALGGVHVFGDDKPAKIRLGVIGCGGIMTHHVKGLVERRDAAFLAWLCDVDPAQIERMDKLVTAGWHWRT